MKLYNDATGQEAAFGAELGAAVDIQTLILKHVAPSLGCIIATMMFFSPISAIQAAQKSGHLGSLNPLPLVATVANCLVWLIYGSFNQDPYVIVANEPGLLVGLYMTIVAYGLADSKARDGMLKAILFFAILISSCSIAICLLVKDPQQQIQASGYQAVAVLLIFYSSPLSALAEVLSTRSSASLFWPLSVMSCVNGSLWVAYGLATGDSFIWMPNAVGAFFGFLQLVLLGVFPSKPAPPPLEALDGTGDDLRTPLTTEA